MTIRFYNTMTRTKEEFIPLEPGKATMYHCGPTVYMQASIGNFRAFLLGDLLRRHLEYRGFQVKQVMNITDVGHMTDDDEDRGRDKMEESARAEKLDPLQIARKYEELFFKDVDTLGIRRAHVYPRATEHIEDMQKMISVLLEKGLAYEVEGNVFFDISKFPSYGKLSGKKLDELVEGARVEVNPLKRDPRDFALWKVDPHHLMQWDSPWGRGFPGWHIECSAMSIRHLGPRIDFHTGGEDNIFPHHECEIAQSEGYTGLSPFVRIWLHVRHLLVDGGKMSKSLGNVYTVPDLLERGYTGPEIRWALMRVHYRQNLNFTMKGMEDVRSALTRVRECRSRMEDIAAGRAPAGTDPVEEMCARAREEIFGSLDDDLDIAGAQAGLFALVTAANKAAPTREGAEAVLQVFREVEDVLGIPGPAPGAEGPPPEVVELAKKREEARKARNYVEADRLREEIRSLGWKVIDTPRGPKFSKG